MRHLLPLLLAAVSLPALAKDPLPDLASRWNPKCDAPQLQLFSFWVGNWDLDVRQRMGPDSDEFRSGRASERVRRILDGCVIVEEFDGGSLPRPLTGMSVTTFNRKAGKWQQTWVDSSGNNMVFSGGLKDEKIELIHEANTNGKKVLWRMTFRNISIDEFDWDYDRSSDDGKTWRNFWTIRYTRNIDEPTV